MQKRQFIWLIALLLLTAGNSITGSGGLYAQSAVSLDEAITTGAQEIESTLANGTAIVVLNFKSPSQRFSDYVLDELMTVLVKSGKVTVADRANLELIQQEMQFQMSGEVSDSSAQAIGHKLGAQSIVSGSIEDVGAHYRLRFRTIEVVSAAIQLLSSYNVRKDARISTLMSDSSAILASPTPYPNGLNFSTSQKTGKGFLNLLFGAGSFSMKDRAGGLIVGSLELAGTIAVIAGLASSFSAKNPDEFNYRYNASGYDNALREYRQKTMTGQVTAIIGAGVYLAGGIIGFVRPFSYDKALAKKQGTYVRPEPNNVE